MTSSKFRIQNQRRNHNNFEATSTLLQGEFSVPLFSLFNIKDNVIFKFGGRLTLVVIVIVSYACMSSLATVLNLCSFLMLVFVSLFSFQSF